MTMREPPTINEYAAKRKRLGLRVLDIAVKSGVSPGTISAIERGASSPRCEPRVREALGLPPLPQPLEG